MLNSIILSILLFSVAIAGLLVHYSSPQDADRQNTFRGAWLSVAYIVLVTIVAFTVAR
jgi:hypothetical protein